MKRKISLHVILFISILFSAIQPAYCQMKYYKCIKTYPGLIGSQQVDTAIFSVLIDINNKVIEINEPTPIRFKILRIKEEYINKEKKVAVYKVKEENGKRGEVSVISNYPNENTGSPILYYSPPPITIGRKTAKMYPSRIWCLASL